MKALWNGKLVEASKARVPADWDYFNGSALVGAMGVEGGKVRHLPLHLRRLREGAKALGMPAPKEAEIRRGCAAMIKANRLRQGTLRLRYFRDGSLLMLAFLPKPQAAGELRLATVAQRHFGPDALGPRAKSNGMQSNLLALRELPKGAGESLRLTPDGMAAELAFSNILVKRKGAWLQPPAWAGLLEGTELDARRGRQRAKALPLTRVDLYTAEELYASNAAGRLRKVAALDGRRIQKREGK